MIVKHNIHSNLFDVMSFSSAWCWSICHVTKSLKIFLRILVFLAHRQPTNKMEDYKLAKEHFVSNLTGSSFWEVLYVLSVAPVSPVFSLHQVIVLTISFYRPTACGSVLSIDPHSPSCSLCLPRILSLLFLVQFRNTGNLRPPPNNLTECLQVVPLMMAFLSFHTLWAYGFMVSTCVVLTLWAR